MIESKRKIVLSDPYDDNYKEALASFSRLPFEERTKILQRIGIIGPDGQLAPAYADDEGEPDETAAQTAEPHDRTEKVEEAEELSP